MSKTDSPKGSPSKGGPTKGSSPKGAAPGNERWKDDPEEHDFPAALSYLTLVFTPDSAQGLVDRLQAAPTEQRKAKDILRASTLPELPDTNAHVSSDLAKIKAEKKLSPVLLVRGVATAGLPLVIADGYHRVCASYLTDENSDVSCRIVDR